MEFKVGGMIYRVREVEGLKDKYDLWGHVFYHDGLIEIDTSLSEERKQHIIIHELLHGIFHEAGYAEHEEEMVRRLSIVLFQVLKENDFSFLKESEVSVPSDTK